MRVIIASSTGTIKEYEVTLIDDGHHVVQTVVTRTRQLAHGPSVEFYLRLVPAQGEVWHRAVAAAKGLAAPLDSLR